MVVPHSQYHEPSTITIDESTCKQCGQCAAICPAHMLSLEDGRIVVRDDSPFGCISCGHCMMVCPEGSVRVTGRGLTPEDLLPMPEREELATADSLEALMRSRRSVRRFKDLEVDRDVLDRIVSMASSGPMGIPPWDVGCAVVEGRERVQALAAGIVKGYEGFLKVLRPWVLTLLRPFMSKASHQQFRQFVLPLARSYVSDRRQGKDTLFWDAPAVLIFYHSPYAQAADVAIACTYAMLAAESLGLGTTIIGGAPPMLQRQNKLCRRIGIPENSTPAFALIIGHPAIRFRHAIQRHFLDERN